MTAGGNLQAVWCVRGGEGVASDLSGQYYNGQQIVDDVCTSFNTHASG